MSQERRRPSRRSVLRGLGASAVPLSAGRVASDPASEAVDDAVKTAPSVFGEVGRRINAVRYPLVGVPAVVEPGETLRVELDVERLPDSVSASLEPSFGAATPETELPLVGIETTSAASGATESTPSPASRCPEPAAGSPTVCTTSG